MSERPNTTPGALPFALLAVCFFASGLTGLIYEIVWLRRLQLTFGSTTYSVTTVLAAFMAGLGFGSYLVGRRVDRSRLGGIRIYAYLELFIGAYAALSLALLAGIEQAYVALQSALQLGQAGATLLKLLLSFPVLALPAALMGGTLPALVKGVVRQRAALTSVVGKLYGINTAGAACGTALAGMVLIEYVGLQYTLWAAAAVNFSVGLLVLARLQRARVVSAPAAARPADADDPRGLRLRDHLRTPAVLFGAVAVVVTGALSMLYEVAWTRVLSLVLGSSTYAFTIVLTVFLLGIALGSMIYARWTSRRQHVPTALGLTLLLLALALWVALTLAAIPSLPRATLWLTQLPGTSFFRVLAFETAIAAFLLLVPTLLFGSALPLAMGIVSRALGQVGRDVGGVYLANTLGAIGGSIVAGFVLIPLWGTQQALLVGLGANLLIVAAGLAVFGRGRALRGVGLALVVLLGVSSIGGPRWPVSLFDAGIAYQHHLPPVESRAGELRRLHREPSRLLFFEEGVNATISARRSSDAVSLFVNGKPDASSVDDMPHQVVLGIVAAMAHPRPARVGMIGWGSGVTAYAVSMFRDVQRIDVAEIERSVVEASRFFHDVNGAVERDDRLHVHYDDARSFFLTNERSYDVIVSQPSNPWMVGVSSLFSRDFYDIARQRLRRGGVLAQWFQLYMLDGRSVALVLRTVLRAFPHVQLWFSDLADVILLASDRPIRIPLSRVRARYRADRRLRYHMEGYGPGGQPAQFFGCYLLDRRALERIVERFDDVQMSDDRPVLEYWALRALYRKSHEHIEQLWQLKLRDNQLLPPGLGRDAPRAAAVLEGASALLHGLPRLRNAVSIWGVMRHGSDPRVQLERARVLYARGKLARAGRRLSKLADDELSAELGAEAALLHAQIALRRGDCAGVAAALPRISSRRPIPRTWLALRCAVATGEHAVGWKLLEKLLELLDDPRDPDALRISWPRVYRQLDRLMVATRDFSRAIKLLTRDKRIHGGELFRLVSLAEAYRAAGDRRRAAATMDELMAFGLIDGAQLRLCQRIYREVGRSADSEACRRRRVALRDLPSDRPLWE